MNLPLLPAMTRTAEIASSRLMKRKPSVITNDTPSSDWTAPRPVGLPGADRAVRSDRSQRYRPEAALPTEGSVPAQSSAGAGRGEAMCGCRLDPGRCGLGQSSWSKGVSAGSGQLSVLLRRAVHCGDECLL